MPTPTLRAMTFLAALIAGACARPGLAVPTPPAAAPIAATPTAEARPPEPVDEVAELFALLDRLGLPDTRGLPYVRVYTGGGSWSGKGPLIPHTLEGFLMSEDGDEFRVLHVLEPVKYRQVRRAQLPVHFERLDLAASLRAWADRAPTLQKGFDTELARDLHVSVGLLALVLARAAAHNDLPDIRDALLAAARAPGHRGDDPPTWAARMRRDLGEMVMWDAVLAVGDLGKTRPELREGFRRVVEFFPGSKYATEAAELIAELDVMIAEDEARAAHPPVHGSDAAIETAIYRLRDARGRQAMQPGGASVLDGDRTAHDLIALGRAAIPALIAILDDRRLTRTVSCHRDFHYSHHILRHGDAARQILQNLTGHSFADRAAAETWWATAR